MAEVSERRDREVAPLVICRGGWGAKRKPSGSFEELPARVQAEIGRGARDESDVPEAS